MAHDCRPCKKRPAVIMAIGRRSNTQTQTGTAIGFSLEYIAGLSLLRCRIVLPPLSGICAGSVLQESIQALRTSSASVS